MAKILLVDDDRTTVKLLQTLLEIDGFEVQSVGVGAEVPSLASQFNPDLFLIDYHLSDMDGVEVIRALRASREYANTPIVMASGLNVEQEALDAGASTFLIKPFQPEDLPDLFNKLIAG